jgi:hypothetical protein
LEQDQFPDCEGYRLDRIVVHSRVGADGILHVLVPVGEADANREVEVTINPLPKSGMSQEEWRKLVLSTAGSITDPSFIRQDQGEYEQREALP